MDPDARHMHESVSSHRDGYKAHIAVKPEMGIITACDLTPANALDGRVGVDLVNNEDAGAHIVG